MLTLAMIARKSLLNRKTISLLTIISIALSVSLLLGIERVRSGTRKSFESTVSGVDLIAGARSGPINLLLYSVFRIGNATNNVSYESFSHFTRDENIEWTIPISLGDSHKGFKVIGTNQNYFKYYKYAQNKNLSFLQGQKFDQVFDVVLGYDVASKLNYKLLDSITLSHGTEKISFQEHADKPFKVVGVLNKTNTPVDKSVHISLEAIEALHIDWQNGAPPLSGERTSKSKILEMELRPADVTAFFIKLKSKLDIFDIQREINTYDEEALTAILPGVSLRDLWKTIGSAEKALIMVSFLVFLVSLLSIMISLFATLNERQREVAILRSLGASPKFIFLVMIFETLFLCISGILLGLAILYTGLFFSKPLLESKLGLSVGLMSPTSNDYIYISSIFIGSILASLTPSLQTYKKSLADGLVVKT